MSIAGFCVSMGSLIINPFGIVSIVAIVLSAVGNSKAAKENSPKGLAIAGLVVAICTLVFNLVRSFACIACTPYAFLL